MPPARKILVADADPETVRLLAPPLRQRGYQVHAAHDGSRALQIAILRFPDLILLDDRTPLLDTRTFVRILRTNPRTERIPVVLMGLAPDRDRLRLGSYLEKPLHLDAVLARIEQIFRRSDAARAAGESRELEGNLAQIPLPDLLQILSVNRKTGRLLVEREGEKATVHLREGRVVDAALGGLGAEKALWRLLTRREGSFSFQPGVAAEPERIDRRLDELLLEGLRQADELAALLPALPAPSDRIELAVSAAELPGGLHPVTEEVVGLLAVPRAFGELLERCHASDLEAARAVSALLDRGFARRKVAAPAPAAAVALLQPHELHALRARVSRGRSSGAQTVGKVVVAGGGPLSRKAALQRFATVPGFEPAPEALHGGTFGTLGRLALGDGVRVDLVELPGEAEQRPLWRPFAAGAVGALVLLPADDAAGLLEELTRALRLPTVVCGPAPEAVPMALRDAPGGMAFEGSDAAEALRALLAGAAVRRNTY
jgi:DNA-binding response OmpR family regulator